MLHNKRHRKVGAPECGKKEGKKGQQKTFRVNIFMVSSTTCNTVSTFIFNDPVSFSATAMCSNWIMKTLTLRMATTLQSTRD